MSLDTAQTESPPVTQVDQLVETFRASERPGASPLLLGLEHEKLLFPQHGAGPVAYEGASGINAVLEGFRGLGFEAYREGPGLPVIAMTRGAETVSLEPGGQVELSGRPWHTAREAHAENQEHLRLLTSIARGLGLRVVTLGYRPFTELSDMPWMPKTRYRTMRQTLCTRGPLATDMMLMTATGQVSLDWRDEADCVRKTVLSARISPLLVALYANSPVRAGRPTGFVSYRSRVWNEVDPARCGYPTAMLDGSFSYRAYVDWALDAPLLFLRREGEYLAPKVTFRALLDHGWQGQPVTLSDWNDHLSTLFPEVRLKKIIEIRAADCVDAAMTGALAALMRGLLYDETALDEASRLLPKLTPAAHVELHHLAQREGLEASYGTGTLAHLAAELVEIARRGLLRLDAADAPLLEPLRELSAGGRSLARGVLERFEQGLTPAAFLDAYEVS